MDLSYDVIRAAISKGTKDIYTDKDFKKWCKKNKVDGDALENISIEVTTVALRDMRDNERTLVEGMGGMFLSGFMAAFTLLRPAVADETYKFITEGKKVEVRLAHVERHDLD